MRKINLFSAVLSLFLLVPASIIWAQTVSLTGIVYQNNTAKIPFTVPEGKINVFLTNAMAAGDVISGTVSLVPEGKNEKAKKANLSELLKYTMFWPDGTPLRATVNKVVNPAGPVNQYTFSGKIPDTKNNSATFQLKDTKGNTVSKAEIPLILSFHTGGPNSSGQLPQEEISFNFVLQKKVITSGENLVLQHFPNNPFEPDNLGFFSNFVELNDREVSSACSSPRQTIIVVPPGTIGKTSIIAKDKNGKIVFSDQVYVVDIRATIDKANLQKNKRTTMHVTVDGLKECPYPLSMVILNNASDIIVLDKGVHQTYYYKPGSGLGEGIADFYWASLNVQQGVTGVVPGAYNISANLILPAAAYGDVFHQQKSVLNTPDDYNLWANAIKKDLKAYGGSQVNSETGKIVMANAQTAIDNIPQCTDMSRLDECKAIAGAYLRSVAIPKDVTTMWLSGFEAYKAASKAIPSTISGNPQLINWELIKNGLAYVDKIGKILGYDLYNASKDAVQIVNQIKTEGETKENLKKLEGALSVIDTRMNKALIEMPAEMNMLLPGGMLFFTKFTRPGTTDLPAEITHIYWYKWDSKEGGDAIQVKWHFTGDITVKELSVRVNWVSKDGKKSGSADLSAETKRIISTLYEEKYHNCDTLPIGLKWPDAFTSSGIVEPPPKDELDLGKTKVIAFVNGKKVGEGKPDD